MVAVKAARVVAWLTPLAAALLLTGCIDALLGPEPDGADPRVNFDILWEEFDRHYAFFELKQIDWRALRETYRPQVSPTATEDDLLDVVGAMLDELEDGHLHVRTDVGSYAYTAWYTGRPRSYLPGLVLERMGGALEEAPGGHILYGRPEPGIGYVRVPSFADGLAEGLDAALAALASVDALIVDVRHNAGGSDREVREIAGRLADERRLFRTVRYRNGPGHGDFTSHIPGYVEPRGPRRFTGPVAVLTNRRTFSAAESFVLAARTMPHVTVVGDTTGGGSGNPMTRELPNGWTYRVSRWISYAPNGAPFEGVGLAPDELVTFGQNSQVDLILEEAIALLEEAVDG